MTGSIDMHIAYLVFIMCLIQTVPLRNVDAVFLLLPSLQYFKLDFSVSVSLGTARVGDWGGQSPSCQGTGTDLLKLLSYGIPA